MYVMYDVCMYVCMNVCTGVMYVCVACVRMVCIQNMCVPRVCLCSVVVCLCVVVCVVCLCVVFMRAPVHDCVYLYPSLCMYHVCHLINQVLYCQKKYCTIMK